jgi:predicted alternative tryptophan synthase beta-subunit
LRFAGSAEGTLKRRCGRFELAAGLLGQRTSTRVQKLPLAQAGENPDLLIGCTGDGSNFGGLMFPLLRESWAGRMSPTVLAVEPAACPSVTQGTSPTTAVTPQG